MANNKPASTAFQNVFGLNMAASAAAQANQNSSWLNLGKGKGKEEREGVILNDKTTQ